MLVDSRISKSWIFTFITQSFEQVLTLLSSDKIGRQLEVSLEIQGYKFLYQKENFGSQQERVLVEAAREELVPRVEAGQLGVVHEDVLLSEAEATGF